MLLFCPATPPSLYGVIPLHLKKVEAEYQKFASLLRNLLAMIWSRHKSLIRYILLFLKKGRFIVLIISLARKQRRTSAFVLPTAYLNPYGTGNTLIMWRWRPSKTGIEDAWRFYGTLQEPWRYVSKTTLFNWWHFHSIGTTAVFNADNFRKWSGEGYMSRWLL